MRTTYIVSLYLFAACILPAQDPPAAPAFDPIAAAELEALRRAETRMVMDLNLKRAQELQKSKQFDAAATVYEEAIGLARKLGNLKAVDKELDKARRGIVYSRLRLALDFQNRNLFKEADAEAAKAQVYDPDSSKLRKFREFNEEVRVAHLGQVPSPEISNAVNAFKDNRAQVLTLIRDGKAYFELRQFDEAEQKLKEAVKLDPQSDVAYYYLRLILEAKYDLEGRARDHTFHERVIEVAEAWNRQTRTDLPQPNPYYLTNSSLPFLTHTSKGAQRIRHKLSSIMIPEIAYDGLTLDEVVQDLIEQVKRNDPEKDGLNFLINSQAADTILSGGSAAPGGLGGGIDDIGLDDGGGNAPVLDAMGNPIAAPPPLAPGAGAPGVDLSQVLINIKLPLFNLKLEHVLDAIIKTADQPIKYIIEEYAIVFTPKLQDQAPLFTRIFKVNPDTFVSGLANVTSSPILFVQGSAGGQGGGGQGGGGQGGGGQQGGLGGQQGGGGGQGGQQGGGAFSLAGVSLAGGGQQGGQGGGLGQQGGQGGAQQGGGLRGVTAPEDPTTINQTVRDFFVAAGVGNLGVSAGPQATQVFFNDRNGYLLVRATLQDLDIVQQAIELLNVTPPQVLVESKFAEISQADNKGYGFEWLLGNVPIQGGNIGLQGGTAPSFRDPDGSLANPSGVFPQPIQFPNAAPIAARGSDNDITSTALRQTAPALFTVTGILTDPQFRTVIHAIENRDGTDVLTAPRIVTVSGRQAQIRVTDIATIVTGITTGGQGGGGGGALGGGGGAVNVTLTPVTQPFPTGPILDVMPVVNSDGFSINMAMIPSITEFVGFDDPGQFAVVAQSVAGNTVGVPLTVALPLPRTRVRQVATRVVVWDHQTVMLGGLISETLSSTRDKLPVLGDLPFFGKLFRSEHKTSRKSNLVIFVTCTIIDPAGNRVHTDEQLPYVYDEYPSRQSNLAARRR